MKISDLARTSGTSADAIHYSRRGVRVATGTAKGHTVPSCAASPSELPAAHPLSPWTACIRMRRLPDIAKGTLP